MAATVPTLLIRRLAKAIVSASSLISIKRHIRLTPPSVSQADPKHAIGNLVCRGGAPSRSALPDLEAGWAFRWDGDHRGRVWRLARQPVWRPAPPSRNSASIAGFARVLESRPRTTSILGT